MRRFGILFAVVVAITSAVATVGADEPVHFAYVLHEGHSANYKVKFNQDTDLGFFIMSSFVDMEVTETCVAADSGGFLVSMTFNKVEASRMFQDKMSEDPLAANLTGKKVSYRVDHHGEVSNLKADGFIEGWSQARQVIKPVVESGYSYLPDADVDQGGDWGKDGETETNEQGLEITTTSKFNFKEMKEQNGRQCARVVGEVENVIGGEAETPQGVMKADGMGKGKFEMFFDPATSTVVKLKASMDIKMDLLPEGGGDPVETTISYSMERELL